MLECCCHSAGKQAALAAQAGEISSSGLTLIWRPML